MATSTFDRNLVITDPESIKKLLEVMKDDAPIKPLTDHLYTAAERERGEKILKQCLSRSKR